MNHNALTRRPSALIAAGVLAIGLTACQTASPAAPTAAPKPTTAPAPAATTAPAAPAATAAPAAPAATTSSAPAATGVLGQARSRGVLRISNTQASPPWNFTDEKNQVVGYDADVSNELIKRMGIPKLEFVQGTFQTFIPGVQTDKWDIVIAGQTVTEERKQQVDFSAPYQVNGVSIFVNQSNDAIKAEADLAGKRIAVSSGSTQEKFAREKIPNAEVKTYENATLALTDVGLGRADAYIGSRFVGAYLADKNGIKVKATPGFLEQEVNAMSFKKGETALKAEVDKALKSMVDDGTLAAISKKWLGGLDMAEELKKLPKA
ncbi:MAG: transporter substrate-binding domain-containing protein [Chloroflexi bacterium]|nr:transporter substrate-binding domain-containing protein [Chloroflexota bacterium]